MHFLIICLPLFTIIYVSFFNRLLGTAGTANLVIGSLGVVTLSSWVVLLQALKYNLITYINLSNWLTVNLLLVNWGFSFDLITNVMLVLITTISILVHIYSIGYMDSDPHRNRFILYLTLFTFFMILLVSSSNFLQFFLSWEGVGVCSYLIINFWSTRVQANKAALKAIIINRVGDIFLLLGIILIFTTFKSLDFNLLLSLFPYILYKKTLIIFGYSVTYLNLITVCLIIGAVGKSAQLGLHTWLPDAMEGPTPVSALLHAATMVTAGIFLILKCSFLLEYNTNVKCIITFWGLLTAFFSASVACVQTDIKKIIAYSTCSQLGYMIFTIGLSQYQLSLFHLFNHAFFKAILFLSAGIIIHSFSDEQDIRKTGKIATLLPSLYIVNLIATLTITGFPFLSGFYSKDVIIETAYNSLIVTNSAIYWIAVVTALLTAFYSFKILLIVFYEPIKSVRLKIEKFHSISNILFIPILILCFFSCFIGFITRELFIGLGENNFLFIILPENYTLIANEFTIVSIKLIPLSFTFLSFLILIYVSKNICIYKIVFLPFIFKKMILFFNYKWYIDNIFNLVALKIFGLSYKITYKLIDKNLFEYYFIQSATRVVEKISLFLIRFNSGIILHHISLLFLTLLFFTSIITL